MKLRNRKREQFIYLTTILSIFFITCSFNLQAQHQNDPASDILSLTEKYYGTSDKLVNGIIYLPKNPNAKGNPFYPFDEYKKGKVFVQNTAYDVEQLKYDASIQNPILKSTISKSATVEIELNNSLVDSFLVGESKFLSGRHTGIPGMEDVYIEVVHRGNFKFLAYRKIVFKEDYSRKYPYGRYTMLPSVYFYILDDQLMKVTNKREFYVLFPEKKKEIRKYLRKNKISFKKATAKELNNLLIFSDNKH